MEQYAKWFALARRLTGDPLLEVLSFENIVPDVQQTSRNFLKKEARHVEPCCWGRRSWKGAQYVEEIRTRMYERERKIDIW